MSSNILLFKKIIIVRERGVHFRVLFARYNKPVMKTAFFEKRTCGVLGELTNFPGGKL
ncbi:hypothetical protein LQZ19_01135 [Treponema primitia]|uniref:hypothetical protein n=1 Tax=Treponema primitia TaxID=88058 RepID=UPI00397FF895